MDGFEERAVGVLRTAVFSGDNERIVASSVEIFAIVIIRAEGGVFDIVVAPIVTHGLLALGEEFVCNIVEDFVGEMRVVGQEFVEDGFGALVVFIGAVVEKGAPRAELGAGAELVLGVVAFFLLAVVTGGHQGAVDLVERALEEIGETRKEVGVLDADDADLTVEQVVIFELEEGGGEFGVGVGKPELGGLLFELVGIEGNGFVAVDCAF